MRLAVLAACGLFAISAPAWAQDVAPRSVDDVFEVIETDPVEAKRRAEVLAEAGDAEAMNLLAAMLEHDGPHWRADPAASRSWMRRAVDAGSVVAHLNLGLRLILEDDPAGWARGVQLIRVAEADDALQPMTHYPLAYAHLFGRGVDVDLSRGTEYLRQAVDHEPENMQARFLLGRSYAYGWSGDARPEEAYRHLRIAADAGDWRAQWEVGMMLLEGRGVPADPAEAYRHVRTSGEAGHAPGMISTAVMLAMGQGVARDPAQARVWYLRAAERHNSAHALRGLAGMLLTGEGGPPDLNRGMAYLEMALEAGDEVAPRLMEVVGSRIEGRYDRAEVDRIKADWIAARGKPD